MKYGVMQMRTEVLRYLLEVNEQKSISKAANHLYLSKSALSESISPVSYTHLVRIPPPPPAKALECTAFKGDRWHPSAGQSIKNVGGVDQRIKKRALGSIPGLAFLVGIDGSKGAVQPSLLIVV